MDSSKVRTPEGKSPRLLPPITNGDGHPFHPTTTASARSDGSLHLNPRVKGENPKMWTGAYGGCFGDKESPRASEDEVADMCSFLDRNREWLQTYVVESVPMEELETWFFKKMKTLHVEERAHQNKLAKIRDRIFPRSPFATLLRVLQDHMSENAVVWELSRAVTTAVGVDAYRIYKMYPDHPDFVQCFPIEQKRLEKGTFLHMERADPNQIRIALEAATKKAVVRISRHEDPLRFPTTPVELFKEFKVKRTKRANHLMCMPIFNSGSKVEYVIEMWRVKERFKERDDDMCGPYMTWGSLCLHFCSLYLDKIRENNMTDFLLDVVKAIFEEMVSLDQLIKRILEFAQRLVNADRASLFLVDTINNELVSTVFDLRFEPGNNKDVEKKEIRMPINRGIAGHVATSGETLNIPDAYADCRFNREVDEATGYKTASILCMPIKVEGKIIGVVQMVNKRGEISFGHEDELSFETFSTFFGLALHNARLYDRIMRKEQKYRVALEVLSYHNTCKENEVETMINDDEHICTELNDFSLDPYSFNEIQKCKLAITMFDHLFSLKHFDKTILTRFVLTVKKNYRTVPYHNFEHGWSVAHAMYVILMNDIDERFDYTRRLALFVASLCHDLDHRGYTNKYMSETASPLAAMYTTSTLEHHHFNITVTILQQDGHNIFSQISSQQYKEILGYIRQAILATDLAAFFPNLEKMQAILDRTNRFQYFDWSVPMHIDLAMAISMTAADLSASSKPWRVQLTTVKVIFEEFYAQGDKEKAQGKTPIPMMDRDKPEEQPSSQVGFLSQICIPCYTMLHKILPYTFPMLQMVQLNLSYWSQRAKEALKQKEFKEDNTDDKTIMPSENLKDNDNITNDPLTVNFKRKKAYYKSKTTHEGASTSKTITDCVAPEASNTNETLTSRDDVIETVQENETTPEIIKSNADHKKISTAEEITLNKIDEVPEIETIVESTSSDSIVSFHEKVNNLEPIMEHEAVEYLETTLSDTLISESKINEKIIVHETTSVIVHVVSHEKSNETVTVDKPIAVDELVNNDVVGIRTEVTGPPNTPAAGVSTEVTGPPNTPVNSDTLHKEAYMVRSKEESKYGAIKKQTTDKKPKIINKLSWEEEEKPLPDPRSIGDLYQSCWREGDPWEDDEDVVIRPKPQRKSKSNKKQELKGDKHKVD